MVAGRALLLVTGAARSSADAVLLSGNRVLLIKIALIWVASILLWGSAAAAGHLIAYL